MNAKSQSPVVDQTQRLLQIEGLEAAIRETEAKLAAVDTCAEDAPRLEMLLLMHRTTLLELELAE